MERHKRSAAEKLEYYKKKVRRYENLQNPDQQPGLSYTPARSSYLASSDYEEVMAVEVDPFQEVDIDEEETVHDDPAPAPVKPAETSTPAVPSTSTPNPASQEAPSPQVELDPELLKALGEATDDAPEFGEAILANLANLWTPLLKKGLTKEAKDQLSKEYLVPENCKLLQAPKLNAEISAAVTQLARNRDKKVQGYQQQLCIGISAVSRAMTALLQSDDKTTAIKHLSNGCRLLCDLHCLNTTERTKYIIPNLDRNFVQIIQDLEREDTLFGSKLSEKIKASKAIERQGLQIKKAAVKTPAPQLASSRPANNQGNWSSPFRSSSRGGRGGDRRPPTNRYNNQSNQRLPRASQPLPPLQRQQNAPRGAPRTQRR